MGRLKSKLNRKSIITVVLVLVLGVVIFMTYKSFGILRQRQNFEMPDQVKMIEETTVAETEK